MRDSEAVAINEFVVREFRLHAAEGADQAARIVATFAVGVEVMEEPGAAPRAGTRPSRVSSMAIASSARHS